MPAEARRVYDVRDVARSIVDGGWLLEISPRYARNIVCALGRLDGRAVGVIANQPQAVGIINRREIGAADDPAKASDKLAAAYSETHLSSTAASADGYVDEVIAPSETRARVAAVLASLESAPRRRRQAGNLPL